MTQFWASLLSLSGCCSDLDAVFVLQQLFGSDCLWIVDAIVVQRVVHCASTVGHWYFWPIRLCEVPRSVSATVHAWAEERVFHQDVVLALGCECVVSFPCTCTWLLSLFLCWWGMIGSLCVFGCAVLGRFEACEWVGYGTLVLGYDALPCGVAHGSWQGCIDLRVSCLPFLLFWV